MCPTYAAWITGINLIWSVESLVGLVEKYTSFISVSEPKLHLFLYTRIFHKGVRRGLIRKQQQYDIQLKDQSGEKIPRAPRSALGASARLH